MTPRKAYLTRVIATCAVLAFAAVANVATATEKYPSKPVTILVGYAPGGSADAVARLIGSDLSTKLGQPVIIENRPGAGSNIAASFAAKSANDGHTLFLGSNASAINYTLYKNLAYNLKKDLVPVVYVTSFANILVTRNGLSVHNVKELISYAKANPLKLNYASSGSGSSTHLSAALFESLVGVKMTHVPYKGSSPALTDLIGENVDVMFDTAPSVLPLIKGGKVRALAITSAERQAYAPAIPTVAESGLSGFEVKSWYGLFAPAGTLPEILKLINAQVNETLQSAPIRAHLASIGASPEGGNQQRFASHVESEIEKWAAVVKKSGASVD